jgi:hypothetical protein
MKLETPETLAELEATGPLEQSEPLEPTYTADPALDRIAQGIFEDHRKSINAAIWRTLGLNVDISPDIEKDVRDAENRTLWWVRRNIHALLQPGTAKLSTRLYAGARLQAMGVNKTNLRNHLQFVLMDTTDETAVAKAKKDFKQVATDKARAESARQANPAKMLRMLCHECGGKVSDVVSESNGSMPSALYTLECGHVRAA